MELLSVNVGLPREITYQGKMIQSRIFKAPVQGPVRVKGLNLKGDRHADLAVHVRHHEHRVTIADITRLDTSTKADLKAMCRGMEVTALSESRRGYFRGRIEQSANS